MPEKRYFSKKSKKNNFMIRMRSSQHSTWQGEITCLDTKEKQLFRSTLELIRLLDSAIDEPIRIAIQDEEELAEE